MVKTTMGYAQFMKEKRLCQNRPEVDRREFLWINPTYRYF